MSCDTEAITARLKNANVFDSDPLRVGELLGDIAALLAEVSRLRVELDGWKRAALACVVPMEALHADNLNGSQLIAPSLREYLADGVVLLRHAVARSQENGT